jgi:transcription-repair coupling factor (superfamily II helicase)
MGSPYADDGNRQGNVLDQPTMPHHSPFWHTEDQQRAVAAVCMDLPAPALTELALRGDGARFLPSR